MTKAFADIATDLLQPEGQSKFEDRFRKYLKDLPAGKLKLATEYDDPDAMQMLQQRLPKLLANAQTILPLKDYPVEESVMPKELRGKNVKVTSSDAGLPSLEVEKRANEQMSLVNPALFEHPDKMKEILTAIEKKNPDKVGRLFDEQTWLKPAENKEAVAKKQKKRKKNG